MRLHHFPAASSVRNAPGYHLQLQLNALVGSGLLGKSIYLEPQLFERAEYLQAALDELHTIYGTFDNYLRVALGLSDDQIAQIRQNLLKG